MNDDKDDDINRNAFNYNNLTYYTNYETLFVN